MTMTPPATGGGETSDEQRFAAVRQLLLERMRARRVVPWVGAGASLAVFKGWKQIVEELEGDTSAEQGDEKELTLAERAESVRLEKHWSREQLIEAVTRILPLDRSAAPQRCHELLVSGPWAGIVTTNWDDLLERAWDRLALIEEHGEIFKRQGRHLVACLRQHARRAWSQLKAGVFPPPLIRLHGGLEGVEARAEFVLGHLDYRRVLLHDVAVRELMRSLASEFSLLFYGTSLTDHDLLAILDEVNETLGSAVGPHFWLTADVVSPRREKFLRRVYGIHTLRRASWTEVEGALAAIIGESWRAGSLPLSMSWNVMPHDDGPKLRPTGGGSSDPGKQIVVELTSEAIDQDDLTSASKAVAITVAIDNEAVHRGSQQSMLSKLLGHETVRSLPDIPIDPGGVATWRDPRSGRKAWLVCGQSPEGHEPSAGFGQTGLVWKATTGLVALWRETPTLELSMPLIASGGGKLLRHEALAAQLHALGFALANRGGPMRVRIHLPTLGKTRHALEHPLEAVALGWLRPGEILERGARGLVQFHVLHVDPTSGEETYRTLVLPHDTTVERIVQALDLRTGDGTDRLRLLRRGGTSTNKSLTECSKQSLVDVDITDGSVVQVLAKAAH